MNISGIQSADLAEILPAEGVVPISARFESAWASAYLGSGQDLQAIHAASNDPHTASNPERLFQLQLQLQDYTKRMTVTAGLVNHGVKTVETLLKS